jgi:predicted transcriptional regulator
MNASKAKKINRSERSRVRFNAAKALQATGMSNSQIGKVLGISGPAVTAYFRHSTFEEFQAAYNVEKSNNKREALLAKLQAEQQPIEEEAVQEASDTPSAPTVAIEDLAARQMIQAMKLDMESLEERLRWLEANAVIGGKRKVSKFNWGA